MRKRAWKIEMRATPKPDGVQRLGQMVKLLLERPQSGEADDATPMRAAVDERDSQRDGADR